MIESLVFIYSKNRLLKTGASPHFIVHMKHIASFVYVWKMQCFECSIGGTLGKTFLYFTMNKSFLKHFPRKLSFICIYSIPYFVSTKWRGWNENNFFIFLFIFFEGKKQFVTNCFCILTIIGVIYLFNCLLSYKHLHLKRKIMQKFHIHFYRVQFHLKLKNEKNKMSKKSLTKLLEIFSQTLRNINSLIVLN